MAGYLAYRLAQKQATIVGGNVENGYGAVTIPTFFVSPEDGSSIEVREISRIPGTGLLLSHGQPNVQTSRYVQTVNQAGSLVENLFKGAISTPGKTLEVVFKPSIQDGLKNGHYTLMETKTGDTLADAVDSSGRIVGKGRLVEAGRAKQLVGASYQLLSVAVAQSHLAEISQRLSNIEDLVRDVLDKMEDNEQGQIRGDVETLMKLYEKMRGMETVSIGREQSQSLQDIGLNFNRYQAIIINNIDTHIGTISGLKNKDTFGADNTFWELREKINETKNLILRYDLILQLSTVHKLISSWIDPSGARFSACDIKYDEWRQKIKKFESTIKDKSENLFKKITFNSSQQLDLYRECTLHASGEFTKAIKESLLSHELLIKKIEDDALKITQNGEVSLAVSFDDEGKARKIAVI